VDLAGPGGDGSFTVAAAGRLFILSRAGALSPFARGPGGYSTALGPEPYVTMAGNDRVVGTQCSFRSSMIFALQPGGRPGIIPIGADVRARRFASPPATVNPTGITLDATGHFRHKLLVTASNRAETTVRTIDCAGEVRDHQPCPAMEGGIAVAPASFGRYGGDLVAPSVKPAGASSPSGQTAQWSRSGYPACRTAATSASRAAALCRSDSAPATPPISPTGSPRQQDPGTDSILRLPGRELINAGVRPGDLLVATEASARTIVVRCASSCTARYIAGRSGRGRARRCRGAGDRGEAGGGHEEALHSLAGHLAGLIVGEGVQQVPVVGDLVAVDVHDRGELAGQPGGGR
jgi:hypothetical protein